MPGKLKAKYIQSLGQKKHRDEEGLFIAEGPKIVGELLQENRVVVTEVYAVKDWLNANTIQGGISVFEVSESELERISQLKTPNKVLAVVKKFDEADSVIVKGTVTLVLDTIQDPGNMGTLIRIADWFGISQVVCSEECADIYNPKVVQATMGSIARVKVHYTDIVDFIRQARSLPVYAAVLDGKDISQMQPVKEGIVVIGNESKGIRKEVVEMVSEKITIPRKGKAESLNAAVAAGIILSKIV